MRTRRLRRRNGPMGEISLTPLIDTALTLLVIFMVATPLIQQNAIKVDLPKGSVKEGSKAPNKLVVSVDPQGVIYFNNEKTTLANLAPAIKKYVAHNKQGEKQSVWLCAHGATTNLNTFAQIYNQIKHVPDIKDVQIALQEDKPTIA